MIPKLYTARLDQQLITTEAIAEFTPYSHGHSVYTVFIHHSLVFSPRGRSGRNQSPFMRPIWLLAHCILGKFLGIVCHCFPPPLDVPTFAATCLCVRSDARDPSSERWNCGRERCPVVILPKFRLPRKFRDLLLPLRRKGC